MKPFVWPLLFACAIPLCAHPMGNSSLSHYARIGISARTVAPPHDLRASVEWIAASPLEAGNARPQIVPAQLSAPVTVVRGDFLSRLLQRGDMGFGWLLLGVAAAFGLAARGSSQCFSDGAGRTDHPIYA